MAPELRKTRFVCLSDTHNASPAEGAFKLPKGDVLIHAGDLTRQGTFAELRKTLDWIEQADCEIKIVIAGNHDITLDKNFYKEHGLQFHNQSPQEPQACIDLIKEYPSITYLNHESSHMYLKREDGPRTNFKVFGSPYSPANGLWAFDYPPEHASSLWDQIHLETDIVITHTPPKYHCDESRHNGASGCKTLRETLWRVRPLLAICGHVHEGRGAERILWDLDCPNVKFKETATGYWTDPGLGLGNKKQSHLDVSAKSPAPLNSTWIDASDGINLDGQAEASGNRLPFRRSAHSLAWTSATSRASTSISGASSNGSPFSVLGTAFPVAQSEEDAATARRPETVQSEYYAPKSEASSEVNRSRGLSVAPQVSEDRGSAPAYASLQLGIQSATRGQGGLPPSGRCDLEALVGRRSRKETCVINAAIMASSWPYRLKDNRKYNKPIIVDIDLPVWRDSE